MRKLIEAVETQEISEGKYGPHGFGRRVNDAVDGIFDRHLDRLGNEPTVEEIYDAVRAVRRDLADQELMGFPRTNDYINKQFIGAVAEKLELPGLYSPSGKVFYSVEKDDAGRYTGSGGASRRVAQELAEKGYLSQEAAERLGVTNFLGLDITTGDPDSDENNAMRNTQTMASGRRQVRRDVTRFLELLAKRNATSNEGVAYMSALARLLTEALSDEEEAEFQELMAKIKDLPLDAYQDDEETLNAVRDAQERINNLEPAQTEPEPEPEAEPEAEPTDSGEDDANSRDSGTDSGDPNGMSLADFAQSGKGGLKNDTNETAAITDLQEFLKTMGWDIGIDGRYGPQTTGAVKEFQQLVGITDDGDAGPQTIEKILVWGKLPDVKTWAAQLKELNELIAKGAVPPAGGTEGTQGESDANLNYRTSYDQFSQGDTRTLQQRTLNTGESVDFRSLMNIVETLLLEAVTEQEQARAEELYNELKTKIEGDGEYMSSLPEVLRTQLTGAADWAAGRTDANDNANDNANDDADQEQTADDARIAADVDNMDAQQKARAMHDGIDGAGTDEQAVMAVLASIADTAEWQRVKSAFQNAYNEDMMDWVNGEVSFSDQDAVDAIVARLEGADSGDPGTVEAITNATEAAEGLYEAMKGGWLFGAGTTEDAVLAILGKIQNSWENVQRIYKQKYQDDLLQHLSEEFGGDDLIQLNGVLRRFNVEITGEGQWGAPAARGERNGSATVNGIAPDNEQEGGWIVLYWEGQKFYVNPIKQGNEYEGFAGSPTGRRATVTSPALLTAVETEVERRRAAGTLTDPTATTPGQETSDGGNPEDNMPNGA